MRACWVLGVKQRSSISVTHKVVAQGQDEAWRKHCAARKANEGHTATRNVGATVGSAREGHVREGLSSWRTTHASTLKHTPGTVVRIHKIRGTQELLLPANLPQASTTWKGGCTWLRPPRQVGRKPTFRGEHSGSCARDRWTRAN